MRFLVFPMRFTMAGYSFGLQMKAGDANDVARVDLYSV
jgi:hypothetical protein